MAGSGSRTLKLSILADIDDLKKNLSAGSTEVESFGSKIGDFGKAAGAAFAVAGVAAAAYAGKLLVDGVKSAIADEAAQAKLATTLGNVTGATDIQVAATEAYILQTSLANGVTDDELRPSLERLVRATKDVEEAQKLQTLALDVSAGSGKSLEAISNALGKAYEGNTGALGKLGVGIDAATLKTMSFDEITIALADTFGGQASEKADTFAGKMDRLKVAFDEGKETVGSFVLDAITPMVTYFTDNVVPVIQTLAAELGENLKPIFDDLSTFFTETFIPALSQIWSFIQDKLVPVLVSVLKPALEGIKTVFSSLRKLVEDNVGFFDLLKVGLSALLTVAKLVAPFIGGAFKTAFTGISLIINGVSTAVSALVAGINAAIRAVNALISGYNVVNNLFGGKDLPKIPQLAQGGPVNSNSPYIVGEVGPELFVPSSSGKIVPNNQLSTGSSGTTINLTVNGAIDSEGTARTIINALNNSFYRGTGGANNLVNA
jgi:hypothetical protein